MGCPDQKQRKSQNMLSAFSLFVDVPRSLNPDPFFCSSAAVNAGIHVTHFSVDLFSAYFLQWVRVPRLFPANLHSTSKRATPCQHGINSQ